MNRNHNKYTVISNEDAADALTEEQKLHLRDILNTITIYRACNSKKLKRYVCISDANPTQYESAWKIIEDKLLSDVEHSAISCSECKDGKLIPDTYDLTITYDGTDVQVKDLECYRCTRCGADPVYPNQIKRNQL